MGRFQKMAGLIALLLLAAVLAGVSGLAEGEVERRLTFSAKGGPDSETCFENYVNGLFGLPVEGYYVNRARNVGAEFTGDLKTYYDGLKSGIAEVASGARTSTVFRLKPAFDLEESDFFRLLNALLADCPYELYWFDKLQGASLGVSGSETIFYLSVNAEYAAGENEVDPSAVRAANAAVANAKAILDESANLGDYEKLDAYRQAICGMVDYNDAAAEDMASADRNAWQLIWVFDGDESTSVVCEGYSKAFQYLCDRTRFDGDVMCYSVTGDIGGGHMWNLVRMPNGRVYLCDLTNCDDDGIGAEDLLFLAGYYTGSAEEGYTFRCDHGGGMTADITYIYDSEMWELYTEDDLTVSDVRWLDDDQTPIDEPGGEEWLETVYEWSEDHSEVTATRVNVKDASLTETETAPAAYVVTKSPTQAESGETTYSATFENENLGEAELTVADIPPLGQMDLLAFPEDLTAIEEEAFAKVDAQAALVPEGCAEIGSRAFADCPWLIYVRVPIDATIAEDAFEGSEGVLLDFVGAGE